MICVFNEIVAICVFRPLDQEKDQSFGRLFKYLIHHDACFQEPADHGHKLLVHHFSANPLQDEPMGNRIKERFQVYRYRLR
ncbi:MAG: hypothetical protein KZQ99_22535 [Candidatus Thiodiazotropha sp. (ex Dulcina madagascariensis)]|nr:hypothetical protein [Candidatus Thiodiazotropha sp. (ex Dulcina madagascariensis)]